jgi:hypothetical protein
MRWTISARRLWPIGGTVRIGTILAIHNNNNNNMYPVSNDEMDRVGNNGTAKKHGSNHYLYIASTTFAIQYFRRAKK